MRLEAWYVPAAGGAGSMRLRLVNTGRDAVAGFELTFTSVVQLDPAPPASLVGRLSGCHVVAPPAGLRPRAGPSVGADGDVRPPARSRQRRTGQRVRDARRRHRRRRSTTGSAHRVSVGAAAPATYRADGDVGRRPRSPPSPLAMLGCTRTGRWCSGRPASTPVAATIDDAMPASVVPALGGRWRLADRGRFTARGRAGADRARAGGPRRRAAAGRRARRPARVARAARRPGPPVPAGRRRRAG